MKKTDRPIRRVLMTGDTVGGVWTFTLELARALSAGGVDVILAAFGGAPSAAQRGEAAEIPGLRVLASEFRLEWMEEPWSDVAASGEWLLELEREYRPDLIHLNSFGHGSVPFSAPRMMTAHSCVLSWWEAVRGGRVPAAWQRYRDHVTHSLHAVGMVTAPSRALAEAIRRTYGVDCNVIHNGLPASRFHRAAKEPFVFIAGRLWDEGKNIAAVAGVAERLAWPVYMAGDAGDLRLEGVRTLGRLSSLEIARWYARASIYALPARYEPFGYSILEAALSGCALVIGDIPSLREIWGDAALFVPPDGHAALHQALEALIEDRVLRERMSERALARAMIYDSARTAAAYLGNYRALVAAKEQVCVS